MKKLISFVLMFAMALSLLAGMATGVSAASTEITEVALSGGGLRTLKVGDSLPLLTYSVPAGANYTVSMAWFEDKIIVAPGTKIKDGSVYKLVVDVAANDGYKMASEGTYMINGKQVKFELMCELGEELQTWRYSKVIGFRTAIEKVEVSYTEPVAGQTMPEVCVPAGANYTAVAYWYASDDSGQRLMEPGAVAQAGYAYECEIEIVPNDGYMFVEDIAIWVNGEQIDQSAVSGMDYDDIWLIHGWYDLAETISRIDLSYSEPELGKQLPVPVLRGDQCELMYYWYDYEINDVAGLDDLAEKGHSYQLICEIYTKPGYKITEDTKFYVNAVETPKNVHGYDETAVYHNSDYYSFAEKITAVSFTLADPEVGKAFPEAVLPANANYKIQTCWIDTYTGEYATGTVQEGGIYEAEIMLTPCSGYGFSNVKLTVNGKQVSADMYDCWERQLLYWQQFSFAQEVKKVELPSISELKLGDQIPRMDGKGNGYTYEITTDAIDNDGNSVDGGVVVNGASYVVYLDVHAAPGYEFTKNTVFTVGGKAPSVAAEIDNLSFFDYHVFSFGGWEITDHIDINVNMPTVGQSEGGEIVFANNEAYHVSTAIWGVAPNGNLDKVGDFEKPLQAGDHVMMAINLYVNEGYGFGPDMKIFVNGKEYTPVEYTFRLSNVFAVLDLGEVKAPDNNYNGLVVVDGVWGYYEGGVLQTDYTGLVPYGDNLFYVENGILDFTYTGLVWHNDAWRYVANSQLTEGYTGLVWFNDNWFYTVDSVIDWTFTGLVPYEGNYFYVQNNLLDWSYTGLGYHDGGWYFIQNGLLQKEYSGLVYFNDNWFYVEEGVLTYQYFGMVEYQGNLFYVQASHLDWSYTGLGYHEGAWYYFQNALYTPSFTGLVPFNGSLFYVKDGTIDWSFNGEAEYGGTTYTVVNGAVQ